MKRTKRIFAIFMTLALAMSMLIVSSAVSFADETTGKTITLTGGKAGHTYTLYQIFTGKVEDGQLTNIQWGANAPDSMKTDGKTAAAAAKEVQAQDDARAFAQSLNLTGNGFDKKTLTADGSVVFENVPEGYYVITDTNSNQSGTVIGDYSSAIIVEVVEDVTGKLKGSAPTSEKKVADNNDTETVQPALADVADTAWQDSADYDIGDMVPFRLKATTADNVAAYKKYHITFQDKQSEGLDAPKSWTVTVLGKTFTLNATGDAPAAQTTDKGTKITVEKDTPATGNSFAIKVTFEPSAEAATYLDKECNSTDIIVKYESKLNDSAKIGAEGNPNESYITYSNNPESKDDSEEGKTKEDKVIVFTYKTVIDKVDETGADLKGADFTLYKEVPEGTDGAETGAAIKAGFGNDVKAAALADTKFYVVAGKKTGDATGSEFTFKGIDDGKYVFVETTVPAGYNALEAVEVTVSAKHDTSSDDPKLTEMTASEPFTAGAAAGNVERKAEGATHSRESGEAYAEIENKSGAELPETGGIGTIIFYVLGSLLVVGCGIVLISKRRMESR